MHRAYKEKKNISEELIVDHCAPTMAGLKTGSLFNCPLEDSAELMEKIIELNRRIVPRGLRLVPLKIKERSALVYMYRPQMLDEDLKHVMAEEILTERNYPVGQAERCLACLVRRLRHEEEFPHEIGLFLGYPPEDVEGFIKNGAAGAKCVGTWKVYGDVETAQRRFAQYKKCTRLYRAAFKKNQSFDRLIVSYS